MLSKITYAEIQKHNASRSVNDSELCASCRHCAYCPGDKSICQLILDGSDSPGISDEEGYVYECASFDMIDIQNAPYQENWVDPVSVLAESAINPHGPQQLLQSYVSAILENLLPGFDEYQAQSQARWTTVQIFNGKEIHLPLYPETQTFSFVLGHQNFVISLRTLSIMALTIISQQDILTPEILMEIGVNEDEFDNTLRVITLSAHFIEQEALVQLTTTILGEE